MCHHAYLYNLINDPFEENNVSERYPEIVSGMENILQVTINEKITKSDKEFSEKEAKMIEDELQRMGYV